MKTLTINQTQVNYVGTFARPALSLMSGTSKLIEGLYEAFSDYQLELQNFYIEGTGANPSTIGANVGLGTLGIYRLKLDRAEWFISDFDDEALEKFPEVLQHGSDWLRSHIENFSFKSHALIYVSHSKLSEGTSQDFLLSLPSKNLFEFGQNLGEGIIYNWLDPEIGGRVQLMIDHSLTVKDGLYVQLSAVIDADEINYANVAERGWDIFDEALEKIGLEVEEEIDFDDEEEDEEGE
jgi:hypothetical protein